MAWRRTRSAPPWWAPLVVTGGLGALVLVLAGRRSYDVLVGAIIGHVTAYWLPARHEDGPARRTDIGRTPLPQMEEISNGQIE